MTATETDWQSALPIDPTREHRVRALRTVGFVAATAFGLTRLPILEWSAVDVATLGVTRVLGTGPGRITEFTLRLTVITLIFSSLAAWGGIGNAAMREEKQYRAGAEEWTHWQRVRVTLAFGLAHAWNLIVPLGVALALALGGGYFMVVYLRAFRDTGSRVHALQQSAAVHEAYNHLLLRVGLPLFALGGVLWMIVVST